MEELHARARCALASALREREPGAAGEPGAGGEAEAQAEAALDALADRAREACDAVVAGVRARVIAGVPAAAAAGRDRLEVLAFSGTDVAAGGVSYVFLARGPGAREPGLRAGLRARGFCTLLDRLRQELRPFGVRHHWDRALNHNTVHVGWGSSRADTGGASAEASSAGAARGVYRGPARAARAARP